MYQLLYAPLGFLDLNQVIKKSFDFAGRSILQMLGLCLYDPRGQGTDRCVIKVDNPFLSVGIELPKGLELVVGNEVQSVRIHDYEEVNVRIV
jgi:hypothetical protein